MSRARQKNNWMYSRAREMRRDLIAKLGGKCADCGTKHDLVFDHIYGKDWQANKLNRYHRMLIYVREEKEGKIQLLCKSCNSSK